MLIFHFDFISPYAWLAWTQVHALAARHGRAVEPVPVLFAAILDHWGQKGPAEIPPKRVWVFKQTSRLAHRLGVPLVPPPAHPFNPLVALRVASLPLPEETKNAVIDALFRATWGGGPGVADAETVARVLQDAGLDGAALVQAASTPEAKERLRRQTAEAIAADVFGVPTIRVDGELFWGVDALGDLDLFLSGEDPLVAEDLERWRGIPEGARRGGAR